MYNDTDWSNGIVTQLPLWWRKGKEESLSQLPKTGSNDTVRLEQCIGQRLLAIKDPDTHLIDSCCHIQLMDFNFLLAYNLAWFTEHAKRHWYWLLPRIRFWARNPNITRALIHINNIIFYSYHHFSNIASSNTLLPFAPLLSSLSTYHSSAVPTNGGLFSSWRFFVHVSLPILSFYVYPFIRVPRISLLFALCHPLGRILQ